MNAPFDFMQLFVIGRPKGSRVPINHLLDVSFPGPGGQLGTASALQYPTTLLAFACAAGRFRKS
ncbi:MAG: hypothetical protein JOY69_07185 [Candidatus Eremiobacteraeota bacterium]|nr:hypothetical protein [Candidatus Eremiobacteraeota bacterium]MBV8373029.1 hypothetical protein [Candidatus Eremiobacteraeota bacterium]